LNRKLTWQLQLKNYLPAAIGGPAFGFGGCDWSSDFVA
jgi:hypothetical protein